MSQSKLKSKALKKPKAKLKSQSKKIKKLKSASTKIKDKAKTKNKLKPKSKSKIKTNKLKSKTTKPIRTKPIKKKKLVAKKLVAKKLKSKKLTVKKPQTKFANSGKQQTKTVSKKNELLTSQFSDTQKSELLNIIVKLIKLHKSDRDGLKSLTEVERILDPYNQKYTQPHHKFDAIVKYGIAENPVNVQEHVFIFSEGKEKETADLYRLLSEIGLRKLKFLEAKSKMENLYNAGFESRHKIISS